MEHKRDWCGRRRRWRSGFRKACRPALPSHLLQMQCLSKNPQTCFEGPFGEVIRQTGPMATANPFTFQTEYCDRETDKLYWKNRYYDPSTGRWLSKDPIGEKGGVNLYGFVDEDPISKVDSDGRSILRFPPIEIPWPKPTNPWPGFPPSPRPPIHPPRLPKPTVPKTTCGKCGPDVTDAVNGLLKNVNDTFDGWNIGKKAVACARLYAGPWAINAWDIDVFLNRGYPYPSLGQGPCDNTFTFSGKCYWGGSLNYLLWGRMNSLCGIDLGTAATAATLYKVVGQRSGFDITSQAVEMTTCGDSGACLGLSSLNCTPNKEKAKDTLDWKWLPYKK